MGDRRGEEGLMTQLVKVMEMMAGLLGSTISNETHRMKAKPPKALEHKHNRPLTW